MPATLYATQSDLERLFSSYGVTSFSDHDQDGVNDTDVVSDCITQASQELEFYCRRYAPAALSQSSLITRWCTVISCVFLCQRRGNPVPESLQAEMDRIYAMLKEIDQNGKPIPGIGQSSACVPKFSNLTVERGFCEPVRVVRGNGSHAPVSTPQDQSNIRGPK
jgi:phage gp36-like protein